ncbi:MAG: VWA domain-containing protein [Vicinamibacterales bacterium]
MTRRLAFIGVVLATATLGAQQPLFRAGVSVVRVDVLATDGGRPIPGLTAADFSVLDNGVEQTLDSVTGDVEPLDVLFTFDRSASTRGDTMIRLRESAAALLDALDADDRAGLLTFNHMFQLPVPIGPVPAVKAALDGIEPEGSTAILDASSVALALTATSTRRTLVLLFTDGVDTLSWLLEDAVLLAARSSEAVLYAVTLPERRGFAQLLPGEDAQIRRLAEATGGRMLRAADPSQLRDRFSEILREMRARYVLTYTPSAPDLPGWHALTVRLKTRKGRVASRAGYTVPAPTRSP